MRLELLRELPDQSKTPDAHGDNEQRVVKEDAEYYSTSTKSCYSENALLFWRDSAQRLPLLSRLAEVYLGTSAASVPVGSLFSTTGLLLNSRLHCTQPKSTS